MVLDLLKSLIVTRSYKILSLRERAWLLPKAIMGCSRTWADNRWWNAWNSLSTQQAEERVSFQVGNLDILRELLDVDVVDVGDATLQLPEDVQLCIWCCFDLAFRHIQWCCMLRYPGLLWYGRAQDLSKENNALPNPKVRIPVEDHPRFQTNRTSAPSRIRWSLCGSLCRL